MLGNFSRGMKVKIPARFQDGNKIPVPVDNVVIRIEHFDSINRRIIHDLIEQPMKQLSPSDYLYEYEIPVNSDLSTFTIYITAKVPNSKQKVFEAVEQFNVISPETIEEPQPIKIKQVEMENYSLNNFNPNQVNIPSVQNTISLKDFVVDVENKPIKGVHINVFSKSEYIPKDPNNVKFASIMTDDNGEWEVELPHGEYVFVYKGINYKEYREIRRI